MERIKKSSFDFLKNNIISFVWGVFFIAFELISITFVDCEPFFTNPAYFLILLGFLLSVLFLFRDLRSKAIFACLLLLLQIIINVGFIFLYDSNGTYFEWAMINQRSDAVAFVEELHLRTELITILLILYAVFILFVVILFLSYYRDKCRYKAGNPTRLSIWIMFIVCAIFMVFNPVINASIVNKQSYAQRYLYGDASNKYQKQGITSNAIYEFFNGTVVDALTTYNTTGIEDFIYNVEDPLLQKSEYFGVSEGNNLIYILVESFEWYVFLQNCTPEQSALLYPNLNKFLGDSVYADNFYAREKTDTSEMLAIVGSNPTNKYLNYDFPDNNYSWALPNMFKQSVEDNGNTIKHVKSFHQNTGIFYNREKIHKNFGFEDFVSIEDMYAFGLDESYDATVVTPDSITIDLMKDEMFPITELNEQYMTFWITYIMHGSYSYNETFESAGYYDKLDDVGAYPKGLSEKDDFMRTYAAAVMDFDKALGIMMDKLEDNGQLDKTTIVLFADHNTYYHNLANYAKNIKPRYHSELFRIPMMIYDQKFSTQYIANEGTNVISKFTTTADLIPTIFDLFGIEGYKNLYFGSSMLLNDVESIIFSRAYGVFVTDKIVCYGINDLLYKDKDLTKEDIKDFIKRAEVHLKKLEYIDKIIYNDYFKDKPLKKT